MQKYKQMLEGNVTEAILPDKIRINDQKKNKDLPVYATQKSKFKQLPIFSYLEPISESETTSVYAEKNLAQLKKTFAGGF